MKRISIIVAAMALVLGLSQCKKEQTTTANEDETVTITLDIQHNGGTRMGVNTSTGEVTYEEGDVVYVASGGKFIGTLTHNGTNFGGTITNRTVGEPLYFYFLGNVTPAETLTEGTTTTCSVVISDQTEHLPVIECGPSNETYTSGVTTFTAFLLNKCALVKFNVTTSSEAATCVTGFNNKVSVNFEDASFIYSKTNGGNVILPTGSGDKWAILLPQDAMEIGEAGSAYSADGAYTGTCGAVPAIAENGYYITGIEVSVMTIDLDCVDLGLPSGLLWATCNVGAETPEDYGDYFAWGETSQKNYYFWDSYLYCNGSYFTLTKYCNNSSYGNNGFTDHLTALLPEDDAATANIGSNWRIPTKQEWMELYYNTTPTGATKNGIFGTLFTASNGNSIFLPAAGYRGRSSIGDVGIWGIYWCKELETEKPYEAQRVGFYGASWNVGGHDRYFGHTIRPVRSAE